jgi:hypothetical protein
MQISSTPELKSASRSANWPRVRAEHDSGHRARLRQKMIKAFGEKVFDVIGAEPDRLREVTGIGAVRAKRITDAWAEQKIVREIMVFLTVMGSEPPGQFASSRPTGPTPCRS